MNVAKIFLRAAAILETNSDLSYRTFECSIRVASGMLLRFESSEHDTCVANLERLKKLRGEGIDDISTPNDMRLHRFVAASAAEDARQKLDEQMNILETQLNNATNDSEDDPGAILECRCGKCPSANVCVCHIIQ